MYNKSKYLIFVFTWLLVNCIFNESYTQISINSFGSPYNQDFNSLASTGTTGTTVPTGWSFSEAGGNTTYGVDNGGSNGGNTYSYGETALTERAFGELSSGSIISTIGARFQNLTGSNIGSLQLSFTGEQWRQGANGTGGIDSIVFSYSLDPAATLTSGTYLNVQQLNFPAPNNSSTPNNPLNGNDAGNKTAKTFTITGISIPNNAIFWIRWVGLNAGGNDDGLAIDDFSLTAIACTPPSSLSYSSSSMSTCINNAITANSVSSISGTSPFTYSISPTLPTGLNINSSTGEISGTPSVASHSASYTVTATNSCGNTTANINITVNSATAGISGTTTACDEVSLTASGGTSYLWSGGSSTTTAANTFTSSGTYTVTVTDANTCTDTESAVVTVNIATAGISGTTTACDEVSLTANGGVTYLWSGGNSTATAANTFSTSGTYTVTVTDANNCTDTESVTVTVNSATAGYTGSPTACDVVNLTATGGVSYAWSGGSTPLTAQNSFNTTSLYSINVTDANGCTDALTFQITVNTATAGISGTTTACDQVSLTASGGTSYLWSGGSSTTTAANTFTSSGTYTVTVTDANTCTDTESAVVTVNTATAGISGTTTACDEVSLTASGGTSYLWSGGSSTT
ncbi:MAG: hypothetical protein RLZZ546_935, partial [Bacteroidota bacterium]